MAARSSLLTCAPVSTNASRYSPSSSHATRSIGLFLDAGGGGGGGGGGGPSAPPRIRARARLRSAFDMLV